MPTYQQPNTDYRTRAEDDLPSPDDVLFQHPVNLTARQRREAANQERMFAELDAIEYFDGYTPGDGPLPDQQPVDLYREATRELNRPILTNRGIFANL
jgi:hypothetical protein